MKKIILVCYCVNDNRNFINKLSTEYIVDAMGFIKTARYKIQNFKDDHKLIITEISMPTLGLYSNQETQDGLKTGFVFFEKELINTSIPVLFWSWDKEMYLEVEKLKEHYPNSKIGFVQRTIDEDHLLLAVNEFLK